MTQFPEPLDGSAASQSVRASREQLEQRLRLWPIGWALGLAFLVALGVLALSATGLIAVLGRPRIVRSQSLDLDSVLNLLKLVFAVVAGAGGVVALVMAYRRQRVTEATNRLAVQASVLERERGGREQTRLFNERFTAATNQLGHNNAAVRLAGVYAMAGLADDWPAQRQTCIDVLCAYLRMPYLPEPLATGSAQEEVLDWAHNREVRHTVIRVIAAHLRDSATIKMAGLRLRLDRRRLRWRRLHRRSLLERQSTFRLRQVRCRKSRL